MVFWRVQVKQNANRWTEIISELDMDQNLQFQKWKFVPKASRKPPIQHVWSNSMVRIASSFALDMDILVLYHLWLRTIPISSEASRKIKKLLLNNIDFDLLECFIHFIVWIYHQTDSTNKVNWLELCQNAIALTV